MILRRAVAGFRRHDWSAVAVELVVVVVGVFLGVQAANWNEDREQDKKSAVFTQRLKDDLRVEAWNYEIQIGYNRQVLANAERAADALPWQVQRTLLERCGDHVVLPGDYAGIGTVLDYPCTTGLAPDAVASGADALRKDPKIVALLQLRITDISTDVGNLTTYFAYMREPLRRLAKENP